MVIAKHFTDFLLMQVHTRCNQLDLPFANITRIQLNNNILARDPGPIVSLDTDYLDQLTTKVRQTTYVLCV